MIISFNNFKSFAPSESLNDLFFERINLIYGLNNSGKSSIIQLLKLFHYNIEDLTHLKTKFSNFNLGSFENILNSEKKSDHFSIFFSQGFINQGLFRISNKNTPIASIGFKYDKSGLLKKIFLILNYHNSSGEYKFDFNDLKNNKNLTFFEFEFDDHSRYFILRNWQASPSCRIFNINELVDNIFDTRGAIEKKLINLKKSFSLAKTAYDNLESSTELFLSIVSNSTDKNSILQPLFNSLFDDLFSFSSYEKFNDLNQHNIPECIDTLNDIFTGRKRSEGSNISVLKNFLNSFSYYTLEKNIKKINPNFWKKNKNKELPDKINDYFKFTKDRGLSEEWDKFLSKDKIHYINETENLNHTLSSFNKMIVILDDFENYYEGYEIKTFFNSLDTRIYSDIYSSFSKFPQESIELLENSIDEKCTKDKFKLILEKIINKTYVNNLTIKFDDNDFNKTSDLKFLGKPNILSIFNYLDIESTIKKKNGFLNDLHHLDTMYTLRPLEKLISLDNSNCFLNERHYPNQDYGDSKNNIYDPNFVINKMFMNKALCEKINNDIGLLGLDYQIRINETFLHSGNALLEPVIIKLNSNKIDTISSLFDAGHASKKIVPLLFYLNYVEDGILTIEEPEANLHPKYQANLANIFIKSLIKNNNELVIETHSELLVLRFLKLIKEKELDTSKISVHFTQKDIDGNSVKKINITNDGKLRDHWPDGFFKERLKELL